MYACKDSAAPGHTLTRAHSSRRLYVYVYLISLDETTKKSSNRMFLPNGLTPHIYTYT